MCNDLKHYKEFEKRNIKVEKDTSQIESYFFYLKENDKPYKLKFEKKNEDKLIKSGLLDYNLVAGYEAIYSNSEIECQLSMNEYDFINLCTHLLSNYYPEYDDDGDIIDLPDRTPIENNFGCKISIENASEAFATYQECKGIKGKNNIFTITIIISNKELISHDDAKTILKEIGLSTLFVISTNLNLDLILMNHRPIYTIWDPIKMHNTAMSFGVEPPNISKRYDLNPMSYFLNANKCSELPFYQFLQYYHCLEYYFPQYSGNEQTCLKELFLNCLIDIDIKHFINTINCLKDYYLNSENYLSISNKKISWNKDKNYLISKLAVRIYNIRNSIVHSKEGKKKIEIDKINPDFFRYEIMLIKFIVEKIIITKSESIEM
jgi:hypothetical protein